MGETNCCSRIERQRDRERDTQDLYTRSVLDPILNLQEEEEGKEVVVEEEEEGEGWGGSESKEVEKQKRTEYASPLQIPFTRVPSPLMSCPAVTEQCFHSKLSHE